MHVVMSNCPKLTRCPEINSGELKILDLMETPVEAPLPGAIYNVMSGGTLRLCGKHITSFPAISSTSLDLFLLCHTTIREMDCYDDDDHQCSLPRFVQLALVDNPQLKSLSRNIWKMVSHTLVLKDCLSIETLPEISQPVMGLTKLSITECGKLKSFPSGIENLKLLQELYFTGTDIKVVPSCIQELDNLSGLYLGSNKSLEFIPNIIHKLAKLSYLFLTDCSKIQSLPELPPNLQTLVVSGCTSLKALPSNIGRLRWESLYFEDCTELDTKLPQEIVLNFPNHVASNLHPQGVQYSGSEIPGWFDYKSVNYENDSYLGSNKSLEFIPNSIHKLAKLSYLSFSCCSRIQSLPELPPNLQTLVVSGCTSLKALPSNIGMLRWERLYFEDCPELDTNLPQEIVLNFPSHAASNLQPQGVLQYSGSEIPGWFDYKCVNYENDSYLVVQLLPPNCTIKRLIKGVAFGIVCSSDIGLVDISITCDCNIGTTAAASWSSSFGLGLTPSDNVYIWSDKNLLGETKEGKIPEEAEPWYERYAAGLTVSFRFSLQPGTIETGKQEDPEKLKSIKIKRAGVSLLY